jgi:hypothetical protein
MKLTIRWPRRGAQNLRLARFRDVLLAARRTRHYRPALDRACLSSAKNIARLSSIEEALHRLPCVDWTEFESSPSGFHNPAAPAPRLPTLHFPTGQERRTAVLGLRLIESKFVRMFGSGWIGQIRAFGPEVLAAPAGALMRLADRAHSDGCPLPALTRIIAFTGPGQGVLSPEERNEVWRVFEVPIFEQCLSPDGSLLAWECEAHEGLHIVERNAIVERDSASGLILTSLTGCCYPAIRLATALSASLEESPCGCGQPAPRLVGLAISAVRASHDSFSASA